MIFRESYCYGATIQSVVNGLQTFLNTGPAILVSQKRIFQSSRLVLSRDGHLTSSEGSCISYQGSLFPILSAQIRQSGKPMKYTKIQFYVVFTFNFNTFKRSGEHRCTTSLQNLKMLITC